jgi:aspartate/methionine/tyrosine aminotransferase
MSGKLSRRAGGVDPFIVMDVMAAAAEKEAAGDTVIHLEVGQPSTPRPRARWLRLTPRWTTTASAMPPRSACRRCANASRGSIARPMAPRFRRTA